MEDSKTLVAACAASSTGLRVLVCGGRNFADREAVWTRLDRLRAERGISWLMQGGASGADTLAKFWAFERAVPVETYYADWKKYGKRAGPIRNQEMLDEGRPDLVVAFPGGRGTADMMARAKASGCPVEDAAEPQSNQFPQSLLKE